jgi:hypothetical protein
MLAITNTGSGLIMLGSDRSTAAENTALTRKKLIRLPRWSITYLVERYAVLGDLAGVSASRN